VVSAAAQRAAPVRGGPVAYRLALRRLGPVMALAVPGAMAAVGYVVWTGSSGIRPALIVWFLGALAMPTAVLVGLPLFTTTTTLWAAALTSVIVWALLGRYAARRATRSPVASWRDWWREFVALTVAMWAGIGAGLFTMAFVLSR
jgi:hypothetical protein